MPFNLMVKDGQGSRCVSVLQPGKAITIGRSASCDVSFPEDNEMSGRHLEVLLSNGNACHFTDQGSTNGTFLNGEYCSEGRLKPGDILCCGTTEFTIDVNAETRHDCGHDHPHDQSTMINRPTAVAQKESHGTDKKKVTAAAAPAAAPAAAAAAATVAPAASGQLTEKSGFTGETALQILERFEFSEELQVTPDDGELPEDFATRLSTTSEENQSLLFLAYALPKRCAVWWLIQCIREAESLKTEGDGPMLSAAERWVVDPTDEHRRQAMVIAEQLKLESPAAWAGVGAFWSHGSLGPVDTPAENLSGKAVFAGAVMAAVLKTPEKAAERRRRFTDIALQIASGQLPWQ